MAEFTQTTYPVDPEAGKTPIDERIESTYPISKDIYYTGSIITSQGFTDQGAIFDKTFTAPCDGIVLFDLSIGLTGSGVIIAGTPYLSTNGSNDNTSSMYTKWGVFGDTIGSTRLLLPLQASCSISKGQTLTYGVRHYLRGDTGSYELVRYRARFVFIPNKTKNYSAEEIKITA